MNRFYSTLTRPATRLAAAATAFPIEICIWGVLLAAALWFPG